MVKFMEKIRGSKVKFNVNKMVFIVGLILVNEILMFCFVNLGDVFFIFVFYYLGYVYINVFKFIIVGYKKGKLNLFVGFIV